MAVTKDDINIKLKAVDRRAGKTKQEFTFITVRGVDEDGFSYTETRRVPIEQAEGDQYQDAAVTAREGDYVKNATSVGTNADEVIGGVLSVDEPNEAGEVILNESIGQVTDEIGLDGLIDPKTEITYGSGSFSINFANLTGDSDADSDLISSGVSATKLGGDSSQPLSSILDTLTGLGTATGKLENKNSCLAVVGGGAINSVQTGVEDALTKANSLKSEVESQISSLGSATDVAQFGNVAQEAAKEAFDDVAGAITSVASLKGGDISPNDLLGQVSNASGFSALSSVVTEAKNTLTKFPSVQSFIDKATDLTTDINSFAEEVTDFTDRIDESLDRGLGKFGGILQDITEGIDNKAKNLFGTLTGTGGTDFSDESFKKLISDIKSDDPVSYGNAVKEITSKNDNISPRMGEVVQKVEEPTSAQDLSNKVQDIAREEGIPEDDIQATVSVIERVDDELKQLDTTIAGSVVVDADFFGRSIPVDENTAKWNGRNTKSDAFTYVSSVEELDAEVLSIERVLDTVVIHATETTTDKNIGAIEINNIHKELGFDGIGYHYVIRRDGRLQRGRPVNKKGEHFDSLDQTSIGVVLVGGLNCSAGEPNPTNFRSAQSFTRIQYDTLEKFLTAFYRRYPGGKVFGHNDLDSTEQDPYFDIPDYIDATFRKKN